MKALSTFSPISLRYIAALRGHKPPPTGSEFTYAQASCTEPESLICLAASNPEGRFYGFVADDTARRLAEEAATARGTFNVIFLTGTPSQIQQKIAEGSSLPPMLDYLCCDESAHPLPEAEHKALLDLAEQRLNANGLFVIAYQAYPQPDGALRFLIREFVPEMTDEQKKEFLQEIKTLGTSYFANNPKQAELLDKALKENTPDLFLRAFPETEALSATFDTLVAAQSRNFLFAGDATLALNYVEFAIPREAKELIVSCRNSPLYEPIKDFALNRTMRTDLWIKEPSDVSANPPELFGSFAYGLLCKRDQVPPAYVAQGAMIDLSAPLYGKILDLMAVMPIGIGDILNHETGKNEPPEKIMEVLQILVACGFAAPMRGALTPLNVGTTPALKLVGDFNRFLDKTALSDKAFLFASQIAGCGLLLPAREAFVLQAINRAGLNDSVNALLPELARIANTPAAMAVLETTEPTPELARQMVIDVVEKSLPSWCAYALLEAA